MYTWISIYDELQLQAQCSIRFHVPYLILTKRNSVECITQSSRHFLLAVEFTHVTTISDVKSSPWQPGRQMRATPFECSDGPIDIIIRPVMKI